MNKVEQIKKLETRLKFSQSRNKYYRMRMEDAEIKLEKLGKGAEELVVLNSNILGAIAHQYGDIRIKKDEIGKYTSRATVEGEFYVIKEEAIDSNKSNGTETV